MKIKKIKSQKSLVKAVEKAKMNGKNSIENCNVMHYFDCRFFSVEGFTFNNVEFTGLHFYNSSFNNCIFNNCSFTICTFDCTHFVECIINNSVFSRSLFEQSRIVSSFKDNKFLSCTIHSLDIKGSKFVCKNSDNFIDNAQEIDTILSQLPSIRNNATFEQLRKACENVASKVGFILEGEKIVDDTFFDQFLTGHADTAKAVYQIS